MQYLLQYLNSIIDWLPIDKTQTHIPLCQASWKILRDLLHTDLLLKYLPQEIAVSILYLVTGCYGVEIPFNDFTKKNIWMVI